MCFFRSVRMDGDSNWSGAETLVFSGKLNCVCSSVPPCASCLLLAAAAAADLCWLLPPPRSLLPSAFSLISLLTMLSFCSVVYISDVNAELWVEVLHLDQASSRSCLGSHKGHRVKCNIPFNTSVHIFFSYIRGSSWRHKYSSLKPINDTSTQTVFSTVQIRERNLQPGITLTEQVTYSHA